MVAMMWRVSSAFPGILSVIEFSGSDLVFLSVVSNTNLMCIVTQLRQQAVGQNNLLSFTVWSVDISWNWIIIFDGVLCMYIVLQSMCY